MLTALIVLFDDLLVEHQLVLVHDRLKDVTNAQFFLLVVAHFAQSHWVYLGQYRQKQLVKHPVTEAAFDDNLVNALLTGKIKYPIDIFRLFFFYHFLAIFLLQHQVKSFN